MKNYLLLIVFISMNTFAQVGLGTVAPSATLDISAENLTNPSNKEGLLIPRINIFPTVNPTADQDHMLVFMNSANAYAGMGYYYWDNSTTTWLPLAKNNWNKGVNIDGNQLIYAVKADALGNKVVILDNSFFGIGTDSPDSELHISGDSNDLTHVEATIENTSADAALKLVPNSPGKPYTFKANNDVMNGFQIIEGGVERVQIKAGGDFKVVDLESGKNTNIVYPAKVYVEADGTIKATTSYSRIDDLKVNATNFATVDFAETGLHLGEDTTNALYTYTVTPTQDILLEISYHLDVRLSRFGSPILPIREEHFTKAYGTVVKLNGADYTYKIIDMIDNNGLHGGFLLTDHLYIPLPANGTTYTVTLHGYVKNDNASQFGIRATFGGNLRDRMQIVEQK